MLLNMQFLNYSVSKYENSIGDLNSAAHIIKIDSQILQSDPIGSDSWVKLHPIVLIKWIVIK